MDCLFCYWPLEEEEVAAVDSNSWIDCSSFRISTSPVTVVDIDAQTLGQPPKTVGVQSRDDLSAQADCTKFFCAPLDTGVIKFFFGETVIKVRIVCHKDLVF